MSTDFLMQNGNLPKLKTPLWRMQVHGVACLCLGPFPRFDLGILVRVLEAC